MKAQNIQSYLRRLERALWLRGLSDADTLAEVESHLLEATERGIQNGLDQAAAEQEALKRFGSVRLVASTFINERISLMQKILLAIAVIAGLFFAYVDSRPTWDDTGITVGIILLTSGLLALIGFQRPWLLALAVGLWLPLYEILTTHAYASMVALVSAFIGAYGGWVVRLGIRNIFHTA
jgi:hypothetical protein